MARPFRIEYAVAVYHVICCGGSFQGALPALAEVARQFGILTSEVSKVLLLRKRQGHILLLCSQEDRLTRNRECQK